MVKNVQKLLSYLSETIKKLSKIAIYGRRAKWRYRENNVTLSSVVQKPSILAFFGTGNYLHVLSFSEHQKSLYGRGGIP